MPARFAKDDAMTIRSNHALLAATICALLFAPIASAQTYPAKPVRMIVSSPPGGVTDGSARAIANDIAPLLGQPVVIDNRGGANGNIGGEACAKANPDGYSVCMLNGVAVTFNPFAYAKMPFDVDRELAPVIHVGFLDISVGVHASLPANSIKELVELARARPGALNWGSLGIGSNSHLYMVWLEQKAGVKFTHVPYKGFPAMLLAATSGEIQISTNTPGTVLPHVKAGKMKVLGVVTGKSRSPLMPNVPTLEEQGFELDSRNWNGIFAQKSASPEIVRRWNAEVNKLLSDPKFVERYFAPMAVTVSGGTPEWFANFIKADRATAAELVKLANLKLIEN
jgi:tripartite-type tricarboxylate transporter receptor subunit TctC